MNFVRAGNSWTGSRSLSENREVQITPCSGIPDQDLFCFVAPGATADSLSPFVNQIGNKCGPAGLMRCAQACTMITVKILEE